MTRLVVSIFFIFTAFASKAEILRDTTIIEFSDKTVNKRVTVISTGDKEIELPATLNINSVLKELGIDTTERERAIVLMGQNGQSKDTILVISQSGQKIQIVTRQPIIKEQKPAEVSQENRDGLKTQEPKENGNVPTPVQVPKSAKNKRFFPKSDFGLYFGLNNINRSGADPFNLRTWPSRYIALSFRKNATLLRGEQADLAISYGPEIAWYNFMFENNTTATFTNGQVAFPDAPFSTSKSKLVMPFLNLPVMLNIGFKEDKFKLGLGGYVGYRIGGHTKTKDTNGNKEKVKGSYGLNTVPYGLTGEIGKKNGLTIFFRYDLNTLFESSQIVTKDINAFSVGIRL